MSDKPWHETATELLARVTRTPEQKAVFDALAYEMADAKRCAALGFPQVISDDEAKRLTEMEPTIEVSQALLKAALEEREGHQARWQSDAKWIAELSEERERLCTALAKYGTHQGDTCCSHEFGSIVQGHCDCGLDAFEPNEPKP